MPQEIELKLEVSPGNAERLLRHPLFAQAHPLPDQSGRLHAIYYDTAEQALHKAGISLRVRTRNGRHVQTVKAERKVRGLSMNRGEWESPVAGAPDFEAAVGTPLAPFILDETARERIRPAFSVDTDRRAFLIRHNGADIGVALDRGKASAGDRICEFSEVELELKEGEPSALFDVARLLTDAAPLRLSLIAKSERGYSLIGDAAAKPVLSGKIQMPRHASSADAFQIIARSCLSQIVRNEALLRHSRDPEVLHQMRVGFRRLNAAISLFKPLLPDRESKTIKAELRWAARKLGPVRDLDVLIGRLRKAEDTAELGEAEERRLDAYENLLKTLSKPRFMGVLLKAAIWIESGRWRTRRKPKIRVARQMPALTRAAEELATRWKRIRKDAKHVADLDEGARHKLRLRTKKLRYGVEFFATLFPSGPARKRRKPISALLERLQDELGELNDIRIASTLVAAPRHQHPGDAKRQTAKLLTECEATCGKLLKAEPFWR